jgi:hypothetical protein
LCVCVCVCYIPMRGTVSEGAGLPGMTPSRFLRPTATPVCLKLPPRDTCRLWRSSWVRPHCARFEGCGGGAWRVAIVCVECYICGGVQAQCATAHGCLCARRSMNMRLVQTLGVGTPGPGRGAGKTWGRNPPWAPQA